MIMNYTKDQLAIIALNSLDGLEYKHESALLNLYESPSLLFERKDEVKSFLSERIGEAKAKTVMLSLTEEYAYEAVADFEKYGVFVVTVIDEDYPEKLKHVSSPPLLLYCKGNKSLLRSERSLAIVGSRKTLSFAEALTEEISQSLSALGVTVVTGSANGADKSAIKGALESGNLISVIAGGINHVYPEANRSIIEKVALKGLVISEHHPSLPPTPWMFPVRNRIIAGLSDCVLISSGGRKSGARHTAEFALDYGKEVYAFPYSVGIASGELCNELIKNGASLCDGKDDILQFFGIEKSAEISQNLDLTEEELAVYNAIKDGVEDVSLYCAQNGVKFYTIAPVLSSLEIQGYIVRTSGNKYRPVK